MFYMPSADEMPWWCQEGVLDFDDDPRRGLPRFDSEAPYAQRFRAETTINTLTVLGPHREVTDLAEPRGPDSDQVRVLVPDARDRRRRLMRRWNRRVLREAKHQEGKGKASDMLSVG